MYTFVRLLRIVYKYIVYGQLDPISVLNALLSKRPYLQLTRLLLNRCLQLRTDKNLLHDVIRNNYQNEHGWSLIHFAAYEKNYDLMRTCIENDADLMITDKNGNTALHIAIQVAQKIKSPQLGCDEDSRRTPDKDDENEYLKIVELILRGGGGGENCFRESEQAVRKRPGKLDSKGSNHYLFPDKRKANQQTNRTNQEHDQQLDRTIAESKVAKFISKLLQPVVEPADQLDDSVNEQRTTNYLQSNKQSELQSNLVNKQNLFGKTSLHYACLLRPDRSSIKLVTILLKSNANADITDFRNCTPLFYLLADHQTEHRSRSESTRKCSKACPLRSPFIDLLTGDSLIGYKCDRLNLDELDYGVTTLKQLCRQVIQMHSGNLQRLQNVHYRALPDSLRNYLSRKVLPLAL